MLLSSNLSLFGKENISPYFNLIDAIEKLKLLLKVFIRHKTHILKFLLRAMHQRTKRFF